MSDVMLLGVLRMPPELWRNNPLDIAQRHSRYIEAADRIELLQTALEQIHQYVKARNHKALTRMCELAMKDIS